MAVTLIAILSLLVLGIPATLAIDRNARGLLLLGVSFLYGSGIIFFVLLVLSGHWTVVSVAGGALAVFVVLWFVRPKGAAEVGGAPRLHWLDLLTLWTLVGYALYATIARLWEWDYWAIWGLKARVFLEHGGIDWRFLESPWNVFAHTDYPLLLPLNYDFLALVGGEWSDRWLGALMVAYAAAVLLIVRDLVGRETKPLYAALIAASIASVAASRYVGLAEGPLIAYSASAVLLLRRGILFDDAAAFRHGAVLLGLAANVKNEGLALVVACAVVIAILRRKDVLRLWPAAVLAAPWLLLRAAHVLPTDIVGGSVVTRALSRLQYTWPMIKLLSVDLVNPWFWFAVVLGIAIAPAVRRRREAFVLLVTIVQLAFYIGTYYATPHDPRWHIVTSWPRLTVQIAMPVTVAVMLMLAIWFPGNAEARSDE